MSHELQARGVWLFTSLWFPDFAKHNHMSTFVKKNSQALASGDLGVDLQGSLKNSICCDTEGVCVVFALGKSDITSISVMWLCPGHLKESEIPGF